MQKMLVPIRGMHCKSCELNIEGKLRAVEGITKAEVSHISGRAKIWYEKNQPSYASICQAVEMAGYAIGQADKKYWFSRNPRDYYFLVNAGAILLFLFIIAEMFGLPSLAINTGQKTIAVAALVGLVAGVSSCMALIGGLVLALSARHSELHPKASRMQQFRPHVFFNLGRILGFAVLGGLIGLVGAALQPSARTMAVLTLLVGLAMVILGLKLIEIFPILQRVNLTLPKFISRWLKAENSGQEYSHRAAFLGGALTFFLPCGFTQAMQLYAISTGSFVKAAAIMSLFALGTAPGLLSIGGLSSVFKGAKAKLFFATAGLTVIFLGIFNISNASSVIFPSQPAGSTLSGFSNTAGTVQEIKMTQDSYGYSPNQFIVKKGNAVRWVINSTNQFTCASFLRMPAYGIFKPLHAGENIIEFTPTQTGQIDFSCSMGMYRGKFIVIN